MPKIHELKTDPEPFSVSWVGFKFYEVRRDDRHFKVGDLLILRETFYMGKEMSEGAPLKFTGRTLAQKITDVRRGPGFLPGWCALGVASCEH